MTQPLSFSHSHTFIVDASDIDSQGHVNNVAYVRWIQDVAVAHWTSVADDSVRERWTWVVLRHEIDYKRQAFAGESVTAVTWVGERTRASWERLTEIRRGDEVLVKARSVWCLLDRASMRPARIGDAIAALLS